MYVDIKWSNIAEGRTDQFQTYRYVSLTSTVKMLNRCHVNFFLEFEMSDWNQIIVQKMTWRFYYNASDGRPATARSTTTTPSCTTRRRPSPKRRLTWQSCPSTPIRTWYDWLKSHCQVHLEYLPQSQYTLAHFISDRKKGESEWDWYRKNQKALQVFTLQWVVR